MSKKKSQGGERITILRSAYDAILQTVGSRLPESGGILLGSREDFVVQKFVFDSSGSTSSAAYDPDIASINRIIKDEWKQNRLALLGFIHSHPRGVSRLSGDWGNNTGDIGYTKAILKAVKDLKKFLVPIMYSPKDGGKLEVFPYVAYSGDEDNYVSAEWHVLDDADYQPPVSQEEFNFNPQRLTGSVDVELMRDSKVVCVGVGGANGLCESLVRSGVGHIVLVDFDDVDENNLVTQGYYFRDIGRPKVDVVKEHLLAINPAVKVETYCGDFTKLSVADEERMLQNADLLMMMTDSFHAQAHGNVMGLKYQVPTVFAMMYDMARCGEITFTIPGVTPACHRCAVGQRYKAYLKEDYQNVVTSKGSTHFHTTYLNSAIGLVSLAILHREVADVEFADWFGGQWSRNLVQLRMSPKYPSSVFTKTFDGNDRVFMLDSVWQSIEPDAPPKYEACPDCGGQGDLREAYLFHQD